MDVGYRTREQAVAAAMRIMVEVGDEVVQHEVTCDRSEGCGCEVIVYRLTEQGWRQVWP